METILSVNNISKHYKTITALNNVSLTIPKGSVFGILGPNGSGKTTLMSIILDILKADSGTYNWFGNSNQAHERKKIGSLLETPNFYHYLSAVNNLKITQAISGRGSIENLNEVLSTVNLLERKNSKFSTFSLGMKQRLAIAAALLGNPEVLLLDEPTNGLDPVGIAEIRNLIHSLSNKGITVIIASHLLDEVEKFCSHVAILKKGVLLTSGPVNEVLLNEEIVQVSATNLAQLKNCLVEMGGYTLLKEEGDLIQIHFPIGTANLEAINQYCFNKGITLQLLFNKRKSLESKFFELTND